MMKVLFLIFLSLPIQSFANTCTEIKQLSPIAYSKHISSRKVTFLAIDLKNNFCWAINQKSLATRHPPHSTFKIPHTLIALETGAIQSVDERIEWNQIKHPAQSYWPQTWKKSQTLATAFKHSAVWYYQEIVPRVAPKDYAKWLSRFNYGNQKFTAGSDNFWLNGELKISPQEQLNFIVCLLKKECGVDDATMSAFESIALQETKSKFSLYAKTGMGPVDYGNNSAGFEGWYVGYIKDENKKYISAFVIYMEAESFSALKDFRKDFSLRLLTDVELWAQ
jgi:beta-lactamase class D